MIFPDEIRAVKDHFKFVKKTDCDAPKNTLFYLSEYPKNQKNIWNILLLSNFLFFFQLRYGYYAGLLSVKTVYDMSIIYYASTLANNI
jgi:hypothetical protein